MFTTLSKKVKPSLQEETLSVAEDSYSLTTKIQASLSLFAFLFSLLFAGSIASQEVIPQLQMEAYNSNLMNQVYGQSYFLNSLSAWTDQVTYYKGVLRAYWEAAADDAIYNYVDSITTSDAFNSVDAYKDYVFKELDSQKIAALNIWENQANLQLLENRNEFVLKLNTDRVDQSYLSRLGIQGTFNQPQDTNASTQELQRQIASAANNWNTNFNQSYQAGLNDFANSLNTIQNKYDSFLQSMNDSEATFTDNLSAIDSYKTVVKDAIRGMVGQFQGMIDQPCNQATSCLYRDGNNGGLNTAGQTLNDLVARLNTVLNNQNLDSSNVLTTISSEINSFLSNQTNAARLTQIDYSNQVTTTQTSLNPPSTYGLGNVSSLITAVNNGTLSFYDLPSSQTSQWRVDTSGTFSGIVDPFIETMIRSITNGNSANIKGIIESQIGGGRTATVLATNVYTDWNGGSNGDGWAYFRALNTEMNLNRDGAATWNWGAERFIVSPPAYWINWFQMGRIGYQVVYEMYDPNAQALATYWNGNYTSLNGQLTQYQNNITPAIGNWESQVASYNSFYEQWKTSADALKAQAQADYENSMADLESKKSAWLNQMEAERNAGLNQWDQLYSNASSSGGQNAQSVASSIQAVNSSVSSGINIATGTQSILDNYNNKLDTLASTEFTFTDTTKRYEPALADTGIQKQLDPFAQIGNLGADYSIGNITKGELGSKLAFSGGIKQAFNDISDSTIRYGIGASTGGFSNGTFGSLQQAAFNSTGITPKNTDVAGGETSFTTQKFSILGAANEKKVDTSLNVGGKDLTEVFGKTANGVYQYSQLLSLNENNSSAAKAEQEKAVNQMAYQVNWDSKWSAKLDETGSLKLNGTIGNLSNQEVTDILKKLSTYEYKGLKFDQFCIAGTTDYAACQAEEQRMSKLQSDDYKAKFQSDIDKLAAQGYEIQNGMIVKSLSREDKIRLGQTEGLTLTDTEKQTASVCYVDPSKCKDLLKQEFTISYDKTGGVTLSKIISNGSIGGKNDAGQYITGTQTESRYISLSKVAPVVAPKGTDLFAEWGQDVWNDIDTQASQVMNDFYTKSLAQDSKMLTQATSVIRDVESKNEKLFQQKKAVQEETDEMIKELVMAYISGGMAGVTASIKSQIEDKINSGLAEAFIRGTGGSEADIQKVADLISLVRGRMQADKMKKRANTMSISNPIRSLENLVSKSFSTVMEVANNVTFGAAGAVLAVGTGIVTKVAGVVSDTIGSVTKALGPLGNTIGAILSPTTMLAAEATKKAADYIGEQSEKMLGAKNAMSEIKANEESIIKNYASQAIAKSTGLPPEVANNLVNDYVGSQKAKKARRAVNANPLANIGSQVVGAVGGIIKTAAVAFGAKERDIQEMLSDGNKILYSGNLDVTADELRNEAYTNQMFGMKLGALSYTSSTPKDKEGIVEELGQRMVVDQLAAATGWDKDVTNALFRKEYGRIKQKKADKKAQNAAIKSTAITAVTTALTLGAAGALGSAMQGAMNAVGGIVGGGANVGAAIIKGAIQVVDGARNGWEGALAGAANGALGVMGASGAFDIGSSFTSSLGSTASSFLQNSAVGLGVSYDKQNGWGGMIGIGGGTANASISFSQRGDTTISGSMNVSGVKGLQVTASTTTNGATSIGVNYNAGKGPREGWNLGANYDINGGGFSGSIGYTNPGTGLGLTSTIDRNGLSTSSQINGVNIATNGPDGFNMDEMNWAEQNINLAQDRTDKLKESGTLLKAGYSQEQIDAMSDGDRAELAEIAETEQKLIGLKDKEGKPYTQERLDKMSAEEMGKLANEQTPQPIDIEAITGTALASLAAGAIAFVGLGGNGSSNGSESTPRVTEVVARRKEDGEGEGDIAGTDFEKQINRISNGDFSELSKAVPAYDDNGNQVMKFPDGTIVYPVDLAEAKFVGNLSPEDRAAYKKLQSDLAEASKATLIAGPIMFDSNQIKKVADLQKQIADFKDAVIRGVSTRLGISEESLAEKKAKYEKDLTVFANELGSDKYLNSAENEKLKTLTAELAAAKAGDRKKISDQIVQVQVEAYMRENKLAEALSPKDKAIFETNLKKVIAGKKDSVAAGKVISNMLQGMAGGPTAETFPNRGTVEKYLAEKSRDVSNKVKTMIEQGKDAFRKKFESEPTITSRKVKGSEAFDFDINHKLKQPDFIGFDKSSELLDFNKSNQYSSNDLFTFKEGKGGLAEKLYPMVDMMRSEMKTAKYYYQDELDAVSQQKVTLKGEQTNLKEAQKKMSEDLAKLKTEIDALKKSKANPEKLESLKVALKSGQQSLDVIKGQEKSILTEIKKADAQIDYYEVRKKDFETSSKWLLDQPNTLTADKSIVGGICYAWSDYALLRANSLESRPFDVWYREQVLKGNLTLSTTQAGARGVFYGQRESGGDGLLGGHEAKYISNKSDEGVWQEMPYQETVQKLKDEGVKTFKVWIDKKDAENASPDQSGQHYFLAVWDEATNEYIMMDHNNNDGKYHSKPLNESDFRKFRKITYFKPTDGE